MRDCSFIDEDGRGTVMNRYKGIKQLILVLLLIFKSAALVLAQSSGATTASVIGVVKDEQGRFVAGANVTARQRETNFTRTVATDENGSFSLLQLLPGDYELKADRKSVV